MEQSRTKESIRREMEELGAAGFREVTLLGQNIDAYGRDMNPRTTFAELLNYVHDVPGIERIKCESSLCGTPGAVPPPSVFFLKNEFLLFFPMGFKTLLAG